ncbi:hypothetical protein AAY473_003434 [Plecturocebus cupreus]
MSVGIPNPQERTSAKLFQETQHTWIRLLSIALPWIHATSKSSLKPSPFEIDYRGPPTHY